MVKQPRSLYLYEVNNKSAIMIRKNDEFYFADTLSLIPPYRFLRDSNKIQSHSYLHINVNHVIFVVGDKRLPTAKYSAVQDIMFKKDSVIISQRKIMDIEIGDNQWIDGKNFLDVAYHS